MSDPQDVSAATLQQLAEVKGTLANITLLIQNNHMSIHQRIDDMKDTLDARVQAVDQRVEDMGRAIDKRLDGVSERLERVEANERATAMKAAGVGALSGALITGLIEFLRFGHH